MFNWTSLDHFADEGSEAAARQQENTHGKLEPFVFIPDTGKQDADFERLGIKKPTLEECNAVLNSMGYELHYKTGKERALECGVTEKEWDATEKEVNKILKNGKALERWEEREKEIEIDSR